MIVQRLKIRQYGNTVSQKWIIEELPLLKILYSVRFPALLIHINVCRFVVQKVANFSPSDLLSTFMLISNFFRKMCGSVVEKSWLVFLLIANIAGENGKILFLMQTDEYVF